MRKFLLLIALLISGMGLLSAQSEVVIGNGTSSGYYAPFNNYYKNSWNETIYQKSDIGGAGVINSISYHRASASSYTTSSIKIYMGETTRSSISSSTDWTPASQLTLVYSGSNIVIGDSEWEKFVLNTPFEYSGENNLVVVVAKTASSYTNSLKWYYTNSSNSSNVSMYRQDDSNTSYAQHPSTNSGNRLNYAANIKLEGDFSTTEQPLKIGDSKVIDYDGYSLKYTVTSIEPAECEVVCSAAPSIETTITIPSVVNILGNDVSVTSIGEGAFDLNVTGTYNIVEVKMPNTITTIKTTAFSYCYDLKKIEIPSSVTTIEEYAFKTAINLENIIVESSNAVYDSRNNCNAIIETETNTLIAGCKNSVIPNTVTSIASSAFSCQYNLTNIVFEENSQLASIGNFAFYQCNISSLEIPSSVTYIGNYAFSTCSKLTSITCRAEDAPETGETPFAGCYALKTIYVPANSVSSYQASSPWNNYTIEAIPSLKIGDETVIDYDGYSLKYTVTSANPAKCKVKCSTKPSIKTIINIPVSVKIKGNNVAVTSIDYAAFYNCDMMTGITFAENSQITSIGERAFLNCSSLTSIRIPSSVTAIDQYAFRYCSSLKSVAFENNSQLVSIGECAFYELPELKSIAIPKSVTSIEEMAFDNCLNLTSVIFQENSQLVSIGNSAFGGCSNLTNIEIPSSVTSIGKSAFASCRNLTSVTFQEQSQLTSIASLSFENCNTLTNIEIPSSVTNIGGGAFRSCGKLANVIFGENSQLTTIEAQTFCECYGLTDINLPNTIISIGDKAFQNSKIKNIELPSTITYIGSEAFRGCGSLTTLRCLAENVPETGTDVFYYVPTGMNIQVPETSINSYKAVSPWNKYKVTKIYPYFNGDFIVKEYGDYSLRFTAYTSIEGCNVEYETRPSKSVSIVIPSTVELNGNNINVTNIDVDAFSECSKIIGVEIPSTVTRIQGSAFYNCENLVDVTFKENSQLTLIEMSAFKGCKMLTSVKIPYSVTSIGQNAFYGCLELKDVICYGVTPAELGSYGYVVLSAFGNIHSSAKIYVPSISLDEYKSQWSEHSSMIVGMPTYTENGWTSEPTAEDNVVVNYPLVISGNTRANDVLTVNTLGFTENGSLTIKDGGQFVCNRASGSITVEKEIEGYADQNGNSWHTIASPLKGEIELSASSVNNIFNNQYDLYRYDESTFTWQNYKNSVNNGFTNLEAGRGYLYANSEDVTLSFAGNINTNDVSYNLTKEGEMLNGFHLIGNPFTHNIKLENNNQLSQGYYTLSNEGAWGVMLGFDEPVKPCQGVLVKALEEGTLVIKNEMPQAVRSQQSTDNGQQSLGITVANGKYSDKAFVVFGKGSGLDKINHQNENIPMLYIPVDGVDYAIAAMDKNFNEIPVSFEAMTMGEYTISLSQENCEFTELYLLDKQTGMTVNILEDDYTFMATSNDSPERFVLLKDNSQQTTDNRPWVYVSNGDIVISNIEGNAEVNIFDAMGRYVYQGECREAANRIRIDGYSAGVYIIQKIDDNGIDVQKIIL